jgi:hypothetical protein
MPRVGDSRSPAQATVVTEDFEEADDRHSCLLAYFERGVVVLDFVVWLRTSFTPSLRWP